MHIKCIYNIEIDIQRVCFLQGQVTSESYFVSLPPSLPPLPLSICLRKSLSVMLLYAKIDVNDIYDLYICVF